MAEENEEKKGILLETGTNEFEIIEFNIGAVNYGINVAKVREVIKASDFPVTEMPQAHPYIDGLFTLRGRAVPLVNLPRALGVSSGQMEGRSQNIIVTEINGYDMGFLVDNVSRIHRISWENMEPAPEVSDHSRVVGLVKMDGKIVLLLDFETIMAEINPEINQKLTTVEESTEDVKKLRSTQHVVVAEDSPLLRDLLVNTLRENGYTFIRDFGNGEDAWNYLKGIAEKTQGNNVYDKVRVVISDIEMPKMDGHRLLKFIREDNRLRSVPVILFSSLISEEMRRKGDELGAAGQISKPEINQLIQLIDKLIFNIDLSKKEDDD